MLGNHKRMQRERRRLDLRLQSDERKIVMKYLKWRGDRRCFLLSGTERGSWPWWIWRIRKDPWKWNRGERERRERGGAVSESVELEELVWVWSSERSRPADLVLRGVHHHRSHISSDRCLSRHVTLYGYLFSSVEKC